MSSQTCSSHRSIWIRCADSCEESFPPQSKINPFGSNVWQMLDIPGLGIVRYRQPEMGNQKNCAQQFSLLFPASIEEGLLMGLLRRDQKNAGRGRKGLILGGGGAALMYFFDPQMGRTRRAKVQDQVRSFLRRGARRTEAKRAYLAGKAEGAKQRAAGAGLGGVPPNDPALVAKVESEVFQGTDIPKDRISINAEHGVVVLRGELDSPDHIRRFEQAVRDVNGVVAVENLMHLPGETAPNKREAERVGGM